MNADDIISTTRNKFFPRTSSNKKYLKNFILTERLIRKKKNRHTDIVSDIPSVKLLEYDERPYNNRQVKAKNKKNQQRASNTSTLDLYIDDDLYNEMIPQLFQTKKI
jgi:hypothetical protein